jgi:hypothetical protein
MAYDVLLRSIAIGVLFGGIVALPYAWFSRRKAGHASHAWKVFAVLAVLVAARFYFLHAP